MKDWFLSEYELWKKNQKRLEEAATMSTMSTKSVARFTFGDVTPKQGYQTFAKYIEPCVPPEDYLDLSIELDAFDTQSYYKSLIKSNVNLMYITK
jgi:hypothetical protein